MKIERRMVSGPLTVLTVRAAEDAETRTITGLAAVFNRETVIGDYFREQIAPGAFTSAIKEDDVRALFNHDPNFVLGRNTAGTLTLTEDAEGLRYEVTPPDTQWARDLLVSLERGDVTGSSFGFQVVREEWKKPEKGSTELPLRTILEARLFDVSPVTYPAYEETTAEARNTAESLVAAEDTVTQAIEADALIATDLRLRRQKAIVALVES